jgi:hypothetical protein
MVAIKHQELSLFILVREIARQHARLEMIAIIVTLTTNNAISLLGDTAFREVETCRRNWPCLGLMDKERVNV